MNAYGYPATRHQRRHGPVGYMDVDSFRPWLRDEFTFRCVYCLDRERWSNLVSGFEVDHFVPVSLLPVKRLGYNNLLYSCRACNAVKGDQRIPDPLKTLLGNTVVVRGDGHLEGQSRLALRLIDLMQLNRPAYVERRQLINRILGIAQIYDPILYRTLLSFPVPLPDLSRLRPPSNFKPKGLASSHHARRIRGELPDIY